jgi:hypothetical protein
VSWTTRARANKRVNHTSWWCRGTRIANHDAPAHSTCITLSTYGTVPVGLLLRLQQGLNPKPFLVCLLLRLQQGLNPKPFLSMSTVATAAGPEVRQASLVQGSGFRVQGSEEGL